jgi:hypothetical protein
MRNSSDQQWLLWSGIEAEGHLKGMHTLFVGDIDSSDLVSKEIHVLLENFEHIYFNPVIIERHQEEGFEFIEVALKKCKNVTVSFNQEILETWKTDLERIREAYKNLHLMLVIDKERFSKDLFLETDTIRIQPGSVSSGNLNNYTIQMRDVLETDSAVYENDKPILTRKKNKI